LLQRFIVRAAPAKNLIKPAIGSSTTGLIGLLVFVGFGFRRRLPAMMSPGPIAPNQASESDKNFGHPAQCEDGRPGS
jgi:hypothetical protein